MSGWRPESVRMQTVKTRSRRRGQSARVRTTRALARALLRGRVAAAGDPRRWFVLVALLTLGCGAEGEAGGEGEEPGDGAESGMETDASGATSPSADQNDPATATPLPGADGNPAEGVVGLPGADGQVAADLEELTTRRVPAGTRIRVTVDYEISTDLYRPGDAVVATVAEDVADPSGEVLIPRGVKLLGRILTSAGSPGLDEPPILEMVFETLSALNAEGPGGGGGRRGRVEGRSPRGSDHGAGGLPVGYAPGMGHAAPGGHAAGVERATDRARALPAWGLTSPRTCRRASP